PVLSQAPGPATHWPPAGPVPLRPVPLRPVPLRPVPLRPVPPRAALPALLRTTAGAPRRAAEPTPAPPAGPAQLRAAAALARPSPQCAVPAPLRLLRSSWASPHQVRAIAQ